MHKKKIEKLLTANGFDSKKSKILDSKMENGKGKYDLNGNLINE